MCLKRLFSSKVCLPSVFFSLGTKVLKPSHRFMTFLENLEQLNKFFMCPFVAYFKQTWWVLFTPESVYESLNIIHA